MYHSLSKERTMPWRNLSHMSNKEEFVSRMIRKEKSTTELCREYGISRKTAYKWINRYKEKGIIGLVDESKRPLVSPKRISEKEIELIIETRNRFKGWGGRKLRQFLLNQGKTGLPCEKTFNRILKQHQLIEPNESEKRKPFIRFEREFPNELWQMDFKGHFKLAEGRCHPLTVLDDHSRFSIILKACVAENEISVRGALERAFREYGLPDAMTMDNGSPWKGSPPFRLSRITVWLMRLGIRVAHSTPRHPQTQGKDERFHRSLKEEVLKYHQFKNLEESQQRFDEWREIYNTLRPHEGIDLKCPVTLYKPSAKIYPEKLDPVEYPSGYIVRVVGSCGTISVKGKDYFLGEHLKKENVGLEEIANGVFDVYFVKTKIQRIDLKEKM
jgi:transposase InsO family protein